MQKIYYLYHVRYEDTDDEDVKVIGIYSSRKQAKLAIERMKKNRDLLIIQMTFTLMSISSIKIIGLMVLVIKIILNVTWLFNFF